MLVPWVSSDIYYQDTNVAGCIVFALDSMSLLPSVQQAIKHCHFLSLVSSYKCAFPFLSNGIGELYNMHSSLHGTESIQTMHRSVGSIDNLYCTQS